MKRYETANIRNIAIVGHGGTGKTSIGDAILFTAKATTRLGSPDNETSTFDYEPEEVARKTSYASSVASIEWNKHKVNVIDTPGDTVFSADTRLCLQAADVALVAISSVDGIEVGTERVWASAEELGCPRMIFVNKMDKERADFDKVLAALQSEWGAQVAPLQIPIGAEDNFKGVVDLLHMKAYTYSMDGKGDATVGDVPADLQERAAELREALIEAVASADDELLEEYLETMELSEEQVQAGLKSAIASGELYPVFCGAAKANAGIDALLNLIVDVCPSPADVALPTAVDGQGNEVKLACDGDGELAAVVFKATYLEMGKVCYVRVFQGRGDSDTTFHNMTQDSKERWGTVMAPMGKKLDSLGSAAVGDIFAVAKLKDTVAGDALCSERNELRVVTPAMPEPCIAFAVTARNKGDEDKIAGAMSRVLDSDRSLRSTRNPETKDHLISGMGQTHIEVAVQKMKRFGGDVELHPPRVAYRECIRGKIERVEGKHKKQSGGRGQYGVCYVNMMPADRGEGFVFDDKIYGGSIPNNFIPSVEKGLRDGMNVGPLSGFPVVDVRVALVDGKYHPVDSDGRSFETAGRLAFKAAFLQCRPTLMEPIMDVEISIPDDCLGDVMGDINSRRGRVQGMDAKRGRQVVKAQVPQAEMLSYAPDLRSLTHGRGTFTTKFAQYEEVPGQLVDKIVADHRAEEE